MRIKEQLAKKIQASKEQHENTLNRDMLVKVDDNYNSMPAGLTLTQENTGSLADRNTRVVVADRNFSSEYGIGAYETLARDTKNDINGGSSVQTYKLNEQGFSSE